MSTPNIQTVLISPAQILHRLVVENALGAAEQLLKDMDTVALDDCIAELRTMMQDEGFELPDWERMSEGDIRKIAAGAFYLDNGRPVVIADA
jgi:hypothetical protein